jgi:hypothetical protein
MKNSGKVETRYIFPYLIFGVGGQKLRKVRLVEFLYPSKKEMGCGCLFEVRLAL